MKLAQIREKVVYLEQPKNDLQMIGRIWAQSQFVGTVALTLTLKQSICVVTNNGTYYKRLDRNDCHAIAGRFKKKLNQLIYGNAVKRHQKSLQYLISVEGGSSGMNLHLHMTIGGFPEYVKLIEIENLIIKAKNKIAEVDKEYKADICDSGWAEYIVKEIRKKNTDSILWDLA